MLFPSFDRVAQEFSFLVICEKVLFGSRLENEVDSLLTMYLVLKVFFNLLVRSLAFVALMLIRSADLASLVL